MHIGNFSLTDAHAKGPPLGVDIVIDDNFMIVVSMKGINRAVTIFYSDGQVTLGLTKEDENATELMELVIHENDT